MNITLDQLQKDLPTVVAEKVLTPYFTMKTNAVAQFYFEAKSKDDLIAAVKVAHTHHIPLFILGGGSNIAVSQTPIQGLTVRNMYHKKEIVEETDAYVDMLVSSGYPMARLVKETTEAGYSGFEHHKGLPGSVGGSIYMNSKWMHPESYCGDSLIKADLITREGELKTETRDYFQFAYDYSILQKTHEIFLDGIFRLKKGKAEELMEIAQAAADYRHRTQPVGVATSGCFFRNISIEDQLRLNLPSTSAGYLIDHAGLKGYSSGNFTVSDIHANFIVNRGGGTVDDMNKIVDHIKQVIKEKYGIELHPEVVVI